MWACFVQGVYHKTCEGRQQPAFQMSLLPQWICCTAVQAIALLVWYLDQLVNCWGWEDDMFVNDTLNVTLMCDLITDPTAPSELKMPRFGVMLTLCALGNVNEHWHVVHYSLFQNADVHPHGWYLQTQHSCQELVVSRHADLCVSSLWQIPLHMISNTIH